MRWRSSMPTVSTMNVAQKLRWKIRLGMRRHQLGRAACTSGSAGTCRRSARAASGSSRCWPRRARSAGAGSARRRPRRGARTTTGMRLAAGLRCAPAPARKASVACVRARAARPVALKLPMWIAEREAGLLGDAPRSGRPRRFGSSVPFGKVEISAPLWPCSSAHSSSATASATPVVGMIAWRHEPPARAARRTRAATRCRRARRRAGARARRCRCARPRASRSDRGPARRCRRRRGPRAARRCRSCRGGSSS